MSITKKFLLFLSILIIGWFFGRQFQFDLATFRDFLQSFPLFLSGVIFVVLYVITSTLAWWGPKDFFRITGAVFFGGWISTIFIWASEMVNSFVMFHLSRSLGREFIQAKFKISPRMIDQSQARSSILWSFALRTNPLMPFRFQDLIYGLTQLDYKRYISSIWHISFLRILWIQCIIAHIGDVLIDQVPQWEMKASNKMELMANLYEGIALPIQEHPHFMKISLFYFLLVGISTLTAWIVGRQVKKTEYV